MRVLNNYVLKELIGSIILSLVIFILVIFIGNIVKLGGMIITKGIGIGYIGSLFFFLLLKPLNYIIPLSTLTGTLLAFGRFSSDNEITALKAIGVNLYRLMIPALIVGLMLSFFSIMLNDRLIPNMHFAIRRLLFEIGMKKPAACLEEGTFVKAFKDYIIFIHEIDGNKLTGVRIYQPQEGRPTRTITAEKGELIPMAEKKMVALKLINGSSDEPNADDPTSFYKLNFKTYYLTLNLQSQLSGKNIEKKAKDMDFRELIKKIKDPKCSRKTQLLSIIEFHKKLSLSFASLVFVVIALPLALLAKREEKFIGFGLGLAVFVVYYLLLSAGKGLVLKGMFSPALCMWFPNILVAAAGIILFWLAVEK